MEYPTGGWSTGYIPGCRTSSLCSVERSRSSSCYVCVCLLACWPAGGPCWSSLVYRHCTLRWGSAPKSNNKIPQTFLYQGMMMRRSLLVQCRRSQLLVCRSRTVENNASSVRHTSSATTKESKTSETKTTTTTDSPPEEKKGSRWWKEGRGGTEPPSKEFLAVASVVCIAGYYAWVIDPPKQGTEINLIP